MLPIDSKTWKEMRKDVVLQSGTLIRRKDYAKADDYLHGLLEICVSPSYRTAANRHFAATPDDIYNICAELSENAPNESAEKLTAISLELERELSDEHWYCVAYAHSDASYPFSSHTAEQVLAACADALLWSGNSIGSIRPTQLRMYGFHNFQEECARVGTDGRLGDVQAPLEISEMIVGLRYHQLIADACADLSLAGVNYVLACGHDDYFIPNGVFPLLASPHRN